jgi:uncharacterized protein (UPF0332 family)
MNQYISALVSYRLEQAEESLDAASLLLNEGLTRPSLNRSYYAMFYAVLALHATSARRATSVPLKCSSFSVPPTSTM